MIADLLYAALNNVYVIVCFFFYHAFFPYRKRWAHHVGAAVGLLFLGCYLLSVLRFLPAGDSQAALAAITVAQPVYQFAVLQLVFEGAPLPKGALFLCSKVLDVLSAISASSLFSLFFPSFFTEMSAPNRQPPAQAIFYYTVPLVLLAVFYGTTLLLWRFVHGRKSQRLYQLLLLTIPLSQVMLLIFLWNAVVYAFRPVPPYELLLYIVVAALLCGCGDFALYQVLLGARQAAELQNRLRLSEMQQQYYALLEAQQSQVRRLQHDMKNHLDTLQGMASADAPEHRYLARLYEELPTLKLDYCPSPAVNALLVNKIAQGKALGVDFAHHITLPHPEGIDAVEFVALLSNMIDNAFEAVRGNSEGARTVRLQLLQAKNTITVLCENDLPQEPAAAPAYLDAGKRSHGNGTEIIQKIAERYGGRAAVSRKNGKYRIDCVLILPAEVAGGTGGGVTSA